MHEFSTLKDFAHVVDHTRVTLKDGSQLKLDAGLEQCVRMIQEVEMNKKKVILVGNGGSAAIASHQAVDLWKNGGIKAIAFNDASLLTCIGNDFGYQDVFAKPIEMFAEEGDLLIAISSSGKSVNILNAVDAARRKGCKTVGLSGFGAENPLSFRADLNFYLGSHSYGIVEVGHLLLVHAAIDEVIRRKQPATAVNLQQPRTTHGTFTA